MKKVAKLFLNGFLALGLLVYYLFLSWIVHRTSYEHPESLFFAEKLKILFENPDSTLITLGTTFPTLVFFSTAIFIPFGYLFAPIVASIALTTLLFYIILNDIKSDGQMSLNIAVPIMCLLFVFHPGLIYTAISGRGVAAILLCFYLLMRSLFQYYRTQTTFYLSMASIYLTCLVFCNYHFIWLLLAFFPFIVLVSLEGLKINKDQPQALQYLDSVNNTSQRRKLVNRTTAIYVIVFLLPLGALYLFRTLNQTHAGDPTYFMTSQYANWHVLGDIPIGELLARGVTENVSEQTQLVFQVYALLLNPLLIVAIWYFRGKLYELLTLLAPFLLMSIVLVNNINYLTVEYYLMFLVLGLLGLSLYSKNRFSPKVTWFIIYTAAFLNVFGGIFYFHRSVDPFEQHFFAKLKDYKAWIGEKKITEEAQVAAYISSVATANRKILIDDAAAFAIIAHMRNTNAAVLPTNKNYITIVENPELGVSFLCIAKDNNSMKNFSVLNSYNLEQMSVRNSFTTLLMYQTEHWAIYRIVSNKG